MAKQPGAHLGSLAGVVLIREPGGAGARAAGEAALPRV
jgi:hypothetical protein